MIEAAARTGTMIEINASPNRRDLNEIHARAAAEAGVRILIDSDAHAPEDFDQHVYGIATRAARLAHRRPGRQHAAVEGVRGAAQAR